jgi:hypothetical protein
MTRSQVEAFEAIATNIVPNCAKKTLDALLERGLIKQQERSVSFRDGLPPSEVAECYVRFWCMCSGANSLH